MAHMLHDEPFSREAELYIRSILENQTALGELKSDDRISKLVIPNDGLVEFEAVLGSSGETILPRLEVTEANLRYAIVGGVDLATDLALRQLVDYFGPTKERCTKIKLTVNVEKRETKKVAEEAKIEKKQKEGSVLRFSKPPELPKKGPDEKAFVTLQSRMKRDGRRLKVPIS